MDIIAYTERRRTAARVLLPQAPYDAVLTQMGRADR